MNLIRGVNGRRLFGLIAILIFCLPITVWAGEDEYFVAGGGGFLFYTGDIDEKTNLDYAADLEFSMGRFFANNVTPELVAGYLHDGHRSNELKIYSLSLVTLKMFPVFSKINLFLGGGFGAIYSSFHGFIDGIQKRDDDLQPSANLLAGIQIDTGSGLFARFHLSYRLMRKLEFEDASVDPSGISVILKIGRAF